MLRTGRSLLILVVSLAAVLASFDRAHANSGRLLILFEGENPLPIAPTLVVSGAGKVEPVVLGVLALSEGRLVYEDLDPGLYRLAISGTDEKTNPRGRSIDVGVFEGVTSVVRLDLVRLVLTADLFRPDPFGVDDSWDSLWLTALPGAGEEGSLAALTSPAQPRAQTLDWLGLTGTGFRHAVRVRGESMARASRSSLGTAAASEGVATRTILPHSDASFAEAEAAGGSRSRSSFEAAVAHWYPEAPWQPRLTAAVRGINYLDASPSVFSDGRLPHNGLDGMEALGELHLDPGKATQVTGLFYGDGSQRNRFLEAYRYDAPHSPREDRASVAAGVRLTHEMRTGLRLAGAFSIQRTYFATGDGVHFDKIGAYESVENPGPDDTDLYWQGDDPSLPGDQGHVYDYFRKNVQVELNADLEIWHRPGTDRSAGAGFSYRRGSYRSFEHLDPVSANSPLRQAIGYGADGGSHSDASGREPGSPSTFAAFATARRPLPHGIGEMEAGLRLTYFQPGQKPLGNLLNPFGTNPNWRAWTDPVNYEHETSRVSVDPRVAFTRALHPKIRVWLAGGRETWIPPAEAVYYSPITVANAAIAAEADRPPVFIFGNPGLKPERAWIGLAAVGACPVKNLWLRVGVEGRSVSDAITPRLVTQDIGSLAFYVNDGKRDLADLSARAAWEPVADVRLRASYDLSKMRTQTLEPELLDAGWYSENVPLQGADPQEGLMASPSVSSAVATEDFYPSIRDRRHRFSLALAARPPAGFLGDSFLSRELEISALLQIGSGGTFTWTEYYSAGLLTEEALGNQPGAAAGYDPNEGRLPRTGQLDLRVAKTFRIFRGEPQVWLEITNVTNERNTIRVYTSTGEGDDDGWLQTTEDRDMVLDRGDDFAALYKERISEPLNFGEPRLLRAGLRLRLP